MQVISSYEAMILPCLLSLADLSVLKEGAKKGHSRT